MLGDNYNTACSSPRAADIDCCGSGAAEFAAAREALLHVSHRVAAAPAYTPQQHSYWDRSCSRGWGDAYRLESAGNCSSKGYSSSSSSSSSFEGSVQGASSPDAAAAAAALQDGAAGVFRGAEEAAKKMEAAITKLDLGAADAAAADAAATTASATTATATTADSDAAAEDWQQLLQQAEAASKAFANECSRCVAAAATAATEATATTAAAAAYS